MKHRILMLAVAIGVSLTVSAGSSQAQTYNRYGYPSEADMNMNSDSSVDASIHPRTLQLLQFYYGGGFHGRGLYRSQRDRVTEQPDVYADDYYVTVEDFTPREMLNYDKKIFEMFDRLGLASNTVFYDNDTYSEGELDLQALITHECFEPLRGEISDCINELGPYYNLRLAIENGTLFERLVLMNKNVTAGFVSLYEQMRAEVMAMEDDNENGTPVVEENADMQDDQKVLGLSYKDRVRANSQFVWEVCQSKFDSHADSSSCYIRNNRLITDQDLGLLIEASEAADMVK